jgi:hypothetical protein
MGIGDDVLATGMARGARARGKRIAFGNGERIIWGPHSRMVFANNPNVAPPGTEGARDIEWVRYYKGHRIYNTAGNGRWIWNDGFRAVPGEFFLTAGEKRQATPENLVLVEPNVPAKPCGPNKQWPIERWRQVVELLAGMGLEVRQFSYGRPHRVAPGIETLSFRQAVGLLERCLFAILPEGGLHHAAAAVGAPAVVIFGGFVPQAVLGYASHVNLTGGPSACGSFNRCDHCAAAMRAITVDEVVSAAKGFIECR